MKNKKSILVLVLLMLMTFTACSKPSEEKISSQMKAYLYEKYGEEFEVDSIGMRSANDQKFYEARIYPKAIIGTPKENDKYYYGSASIDVDSIGRLDKETGDDYSFIRFNDDTENYLLPKVKELFGDRVRIKVDASLKIRDTEDIIKKAYEKIGVMGYKPQNIFLEYKESNFKKAQKRVIDNPQNNRLELTLYFYIFDKIDNEKEKEERRKEIFDFIQYLKKEGLFEYCELGAIFVDERVLAPSYEDYKWKMKGAEMTKEIIGGEEVYLPPKDLRKEMTTFLGKEIKEISEEDMQKNMNIIMKSDLSYDGINKNNAQLSAYIYSNKIIREKYPTALEKGNLQLIEYNKDTDIKFEKELEYIYY